MKMEIDEVILSKETYTLGLEPQECCDSCHELIAYTMTCPVCGDSGAYVKGMHPEFIFDNDVFYGAFQEAGFRVISCGNCHDKFAFDSGNVHDLDTSLWKRVLRYKLTKDWGCVDERTKCYTAKK